MDRVWIELELPEKGLPKDEAKEVALRRVELANKMLEKLVGKEAMRGRFAYLDNKRRYAYRDGFTYEELSDSGVWFNLEFLAGGK